MRFSRGQAVILMALMPAAMCRYSLEGRRKLQADAPTVLPTLQATDPANSGSNFISDVVTQLTYLPETLSALPFIPGDIIQAQVSQFPAYAAMANAYAVGDQGLANAIMDQSEIDKGVKINQALNERTKHVYLYQQYTQPFVATFLGGQNGILGGMTPRSASPGPQVPSLQSPSPASPVNNPTKPK